MKKNTEWIPTNIALSQFRRQVTFRGRKIDVPASPYDLPDAIRAIVGPGDNMATLEFRYISNEDERISVPLPNGIIGKIGRSSGRLYSLSFPINHEEARRDPAVITRQLNMVVATLEQLHNDRIPQQNSDILKGAISDHASELSAA